MRIFVAPLAAGVVTVRDDEHHYLSRVRRARVGDVVELVDGAGLRARAEIIAIEAGETRLRVGAVERIADELPRVCALVPLIKGDRMDICLEKLCEVGVDDVIVWPAARAVVKLEGSRRATRLEHYQAIAQSASRQSGRASVPAVSWADSLPAAIAGLPAGTRIVLAPAADRAGLPDIATGHVTLASGPEGGFAPAELDVLLAAGFVEVGLGPRVLRAETAPVIAVALVRAATGT